MRKITGRERRHKKIRKKISGTADRPRMVIHRSPKNLHVQLVDDMAHKTLVSVSTSNPDVRTQIAYGGNVKAASSLGAIFAKKSREKGITRVVFDRSGYMYHGRIKALAEAAIKEGITFKKEKGVHKLDGAKD
ncbi:MAG: 50S ribosomal protein L18 [Candidatus Omnitrophota bacterium]